MAESGETNHIAGRWRGDPQGEIRPQHSPIDASVVGIPCCRARDAGRDDRYDLASGVFTQDIDRAFRFMDELATGLVNVDDTSSYWQLHIPFGGMSGKDSGNGRVGGRHALTAMRDLKTASFTVR